MKIFFYQFIGPHYISFYLEISPSITVKDLIKNNEIFWGLKILQYIISSEHDYFDENMCMHDILKKKPSLNEVLEYVKTSPFRFNGISLENNRTLNSYNIKEFDVIYYYDFHLRGGGCWDNIKNETDMKIGFDANLVKRDELYINLIHFDKNMINNENYKYYNDFKINVVGGFYAIDDLDILKKYLKKIESKKIPFIVISSGSSAKDVIPLCKEYSFIKEVIIFCMNFSYHKHWIKDYPGLVKKVFTNINDVYDYLKSNEDNKNDIIEKNYKFKHESIQMDKQFLQCPVVSATEYDRCYFLVHRAYAHFFGDIDNKYELPKFIEKNYCKIIESLAVIREESLIEKFKNLVCQKDNDIFVENSIKAYTDESKFCYLFNRMMRNFETGIISFAYYMGPLLYGLNKYVKEHSSLSMSTDMTLYRTIKCSILDFYLYKLNLGHIICFPSLTSTSTKEGEFIPTNLAKSTNNNNYDETIEIKLIFYYKYQQGNISPGIVIKDNKNSNGGYLSSCPFENEVILFPFTFARIKEIKNNLSNKVIYLEIINRKNYLEYTLKNNVQNRILFNDLD